MRNHKNRLEKLANRLGPGDDDEVIVIRLMWGDEPMAPPIAYRRSADGQIFPFRQVVKTLQDGGYTGGKVTVRWADEDEPERQTDI